MAASAGSHDSKLQEAGRTECKHDQGAQDHGEQEGDRERQVTLEDQEGHIHALLVLQDENQDHDQDDQAGNNRRPCAAKARAAFAGQRLGFRLNTGWGIAVHR
jgi:hypothetical protein